MLWELVNAHIFAKTSCSVKCIIIKIIILLTYLVICENPKEWDWVGERFKKEGIYVYLWLIHVDIWHKPIQYCKAIILQLNINKFKLKK